MTLYLKHFGLREAPFKITPTTEFFYGGGRRGEILHALRYAIEVGEGIMMLTGEVGSGKTMLLRTLSEKLPPHVELVYIANPSFSGREILYNICEELSLDIDVDRPDAVRRLQNYLIERHAQGKRVVVFIDEAQAMPDASLEEIRLLSNLETSRHKLLQIAMFGQPELLDKLSRQNMRQLRERITVALTLEPFGRDDIREYISTRLHAAGYNGGELFAKDGCHLLAVVSQGLSRRINVLADKAMLSAFERGLDKILYEDVRRAVKDAQYGRMRYRSERARRLSHRLTVGLSVAAGAVLIVAVGSRLGGSAPPVAVESPPVESVLSTAGDSSPSEKLAESSAESPTQFQKPAPESAESAIKSAEAAQAALTESAPELTQNTAATPPTGDDLLSVIIALQGGETIDSREIGAEISLFAESHGEENTSAKSEVWKSKVIREAGLVDNEKWGWMPEASYLRLRLNATETWMEDAPEGYTARLMTVGQDRSIFLERFLRHFADFYPLRNMMVYPVRLGDKNRFVVTFGLYRTRDDAKVYINHMPRYFTGGRPFVQLVSDSIAESSGYWQ